MADDLTLGITLTADGSRLKGELRVSGQELDRLRDAAGRAGEGTQRLTRETDRLGNELTQLRAKYNPLFAAQQRYRAQLEEINRAKQLGALNEREHAAAVTRTKDAFAAQVLTMNGVAAASRRGTSVLSAHRGAMQQFGFQVGDVATQLSLGANAMQVFAIQGGQMLGALGPWGAIIGAAVTIVGALAVATFGLRDATDEATEATETQREALELYNEVMLTAEERAKKKAAADRDGARAALEAALADREAALSLLQRQIAALDAEEQRALGDMAVGANAALAQRRAEQRDIQRIRAQELLNEISELERRLDRIATGQTGPEREEAARRRAEANSALLARVRTGSGAAPGSFRAAQEAGMDADFAAIVAGGRFKHEQEEAAEATRRHREEMEQLANVYRITGGGASSLAEETKRARDTARDFGLTFTSALEEVIVRGGELSDVLRGIEQDLLRIFVRRKITEPFLGAADDIFAALFSPARPQNATPGMGGLEAGNVLFDAPNFHTGGVAGDPFAPKRRVPAAIFAGAPRLHRGGMALAPDEVPAILRRGERVRTPEQERALGEPRVTVQVINTTGQPARVEERRGPAGGRELHVLVGELAARDIRTGGPLHRALADTFGARPALEGR